jgi:hypothetical protein
MSKDYKVDKFEKKDHCAPKYAKDMLGNRLETSHNF